MIARGDGSVLYNFAVAVDDAEMGITDVVRGDDHLSNTPKQLLVLGRSATSRRATPTCRSSTAPTARSSPSATAPPRSRSCATPATCPPRSATTWRCSAGATDDDTTDVDRGADPALRVDDVGNSAAIFDEKKLRWLNGRYMREMPLDDTRRRSPATSAASPTSGCARPARSPRRRRRRWTRSGR